MFGIHIVIRGSYHRWTTLQTHRYTFELYLAMKRTQWWRRPRRNSSRWTLEFCRWAFSGPTAEFRWATTTSITFREIWEASSYLNSSLSRRMDHKLFAKFWSWMLIDWVILLESSWVLLDKICFQTQVYVAFGSKWRHLCFSHKDIIALIRLGDSHGKKNNYRFFVAWRKSRW